MVKKIINKDMTNKEDKIIKYYSIMLNTELNGGIEIGEVNSKLEKNKLKEKLIDIMLEDWVKDEIRKLHKK